MEPIDREAYARGVVTRERDALRARVAELEELIFLWADPQHMQGKNLDLYEEICNRLCR